MRSIHQISKKNYKQEIKIMGGVLVISAKATKETSENPVVCFEYTLSLNN